MPLPTRVKQLIVSQLPDPTRAVQENPLVKYLEELERRLAAIEEQLGEEELPDIE